MIASSFAGGSSGSGEQVRPAVAITVARGNDALMHMRSIITIIIIIIMGKGQT